MKQKKRNSITGITAVVIVLAMFLLCGCDSSSYKNMFKDTISKVKESAPVIKKHSGEIFDVAKGEIKETINQRWVKDRLGEMTDFSRMEGYYEDYSAPKSSSGNEFVDNVVDQVKNIQKYRPEPGDSAGQVAGDLSIESITGMVKKMDGLKESVDPYQADSIYSDLFNKKKE